MRACVYIVKYYVYMKNTKIRNIKKQKIVV
jgi:hypothetical protein